MHKVVKMPNQSLFVFTEGNERVKLGEFTQLHPYMMAEAETWQRWSLRCRPKERRCSAMW